jgi:hypothetical protein
VEQSVFVGSWKDRREVEREYVDWVHLTQDR